LKTNEKIEKEKKDNTTKSDEKGLDEFEEQDISQYDLEVENFSDDEDNSNSNNQDSIKAEDVVDLIAGLSSKFVPEQYREKYKDSYKTTTLPILKFLGFNNVMQDMKIGDGIPDWLQIPLIGIAIVAPIFIAKAEIENELKTKPKPEGDKND